MTISFELRGLWILGWIFVPDLRACHATGHVASHDHGPVTYSAHTNVLGQLVDLGPGLSNDHWAIGQDGPSFLGSRDWEHAVCWFVAVEIRPG